LKKLLWRVGKVLAVLAVMCVFGPFIWLFAALGLYKGLPALGRKLNRRLRRR
jgi:hypothetical protein